MGVRIDPFLEIPGRVEFGKEWQAHVQYYSRDGDEITVVNPQRVYGIDGIRHLIPPGIRPKPSDWKFKIRVFDEVPVRVSRLREVMHPRRKTTKTGIPYLQYSGRAGKLLAEYPTEEGLVSVQPVMIWCRGQNGLWRCDLRIRPMPVPDSEFAEAVKRWLQRNENGAADNGNENPDDDLLSLEEAMETLRKYREENPLSRGPHAKR